MFKFNNQYQTKATMQYQPEQVWFPLAESVEQWDDNFHTLMLQDQIRMQAYQKAIHENIKPGMTILDIGAGTGILAKWALDAGAEFVYAIEANPERIPQAQSRLDQANYQNKYQLINKHSFDVKLTKPVDMIISEILGNLGDNENMTKILNHARTNFLKPNGIMLPSKVQTYITPISSIQAHQQVQNKNIKQLNKLYDIERLLEKFQLKSPFNISYDCIFPKKTHLANRQIATTFNFDGSDKTEYQQELSFNITQAGIFTGFKGAFIADLSTQTTLDITPDDIKGRKTSNCWKHCYLPIQTPFQVEPEDQLHLSFEKKYQNNLHIYSWQGYITRQTQQIYNFKQSMAPETN